jgi:cobalt-zinc-cadmium efflux system membrane fusion protein
MRTLTMFLTAVILLAQAGTSIAHEGHDHGNKKKKAPVQSKNWFTVNSVTKTHEVVLRYFPVKPNVPTKMKLFLSDFGTNTPIDSADLTITCIEDNSVSIKGYYLEPGVYELHTTFPEKKAYSLSLIITANDRKWIIPPLESIEVGRQLKQPEQKIEAGFNWNIVLYILGGLVVGMLLMLVFLRMKKTATLSLFLLLLIPANIAFTQNDEHNHKQEPANTHSHGDGPAHSHESDEKNEPENTTSSGLATDEMEVLKETQFLFDMRTTFAQKTDYYSVLKLYGKIMPALNGEARIIAPQNGSVSSLYVNIGQHVTKGQVLAAIKQNLSASESIQLQNEKSNANAEFQDATKDYNRLKSLQNVVAGKEITEAKIRLENAIRNKRIYDNLSGRTLTLTSPIEGVVDNFNLTLGQQVSQGEKLITVFNTKTLKVEAQIFDKDMHKLNHPDTDTIGSQYSFSVECIQEEEHFSDYARLVSFGKSVNPANQSSQLILELDNKNELFKPGQFANVEVQAKGNEPQIVIPTSALTHINGKPVVFVHTAPEVFKVKYVKTGQSNASRTVIVKGLREHERVVIEGAYQVKSIYLNQ